MLNFKELVRLSDSITYLYAEKCHIEQDNLSVKLVYLDKEVSIPCASLTVLMLGPGTDITHAALINLASCGCLVVWIGENLRKFYATGFGETHSSKNILKQAKACMDNDLHMEIVRKMYKLRFRELSIDNNVTLDQLRGIEGVRMRTLYQTCSKMYGIPWSGRKLKNMEYNNMDDLNKAITYCHQLLYSICTSAIITLGYNTSLGFIHTGNIHSFVYDMADLYKAEISIPVAFQVLSKMKIEKSISLEEECRKLSRQYYTKLNLLKKIVDDLDYLFNDIDLVFGNNSDGSLWNIENEVQGNKNYGNR